MKVIVLCGGFAKRLWPLTKDTPKPLLPVGGKPVLEYVLDKVWNLDGVDEVYLTTNTKFETHFREWLKGYRPVEDIEIVVEPAVAEEQKPGAIGALCDVLKKKSIDDDVLVIAGDNIFDFELRDFLSHRQHGFPIVAFYDMKDTGAVRGKYGVVVLNERRKVAHFEEKPEQPRSTLVSAGCYFFPKRSLEMIDHYISRGNNPDAPGHLIRWLHKKIPIHGFVFDGKWFDIGSHDCYEEADRFFRKES